MRTLQDVLNEVKTQSDPQRQTVMRSIADLAPQQKAAETGLGAQKDAAYDQILSGARQRGLGFSGIPLGEQAKYNATDYAPALANLKSSFNQRKGTLESSLAGIGQQDYAQANDIYSNERNFYEQQRQYNEGLALQKSQQEAAARQQSSALGSVFGGGGGGGAPQQQASQVDPVQKSAFDDVYTRLNKQSDAQVRSDFAATAKSAGYGNARDKFKLQVYAKYRPDLFSKAVSLKATDSNQVRF